MNSCTRTTSLACLALLAVVAPGCKREDMHNQPRYEWYEQSEFFADGMSARPQVEGTVAQGQLLSTDPLFATRSAGGAYANEYPFEVTRGALERGRQRFEIYCA